MNELDAIKARRDAITPGVWEVGSMYTTGDAVVGIADNRIVCVLGAEEQCHTDAAFIAAAASSAAWTAMPQAMMVSSSPSEWTCALPNWKVVPFS